MATDGTKIIDGDLARDIYNGILDLYDSEIDIDIIKKEFPFIRSDYGNDSDFYHEIFVTAYALAFWEIGEMNAQILNEIKRVVEAGAGIRVWSEEAGEASGRNRRKELDKLLNKISAPNLRIRKRKKYRIVKNLYFQPNDVLTFRTHDKVYHAMICAKVTQQRGQCTYDLVATTYNGAEKPTIFALTKSAILGRLIPCGYSHEEAEAFQPGVTAIWRYCGTTVPSIFGLPYMLVTHKDMVSIKGCLEKIGALAIGEPFKEDASYGYVSSIDGFEDIFSDLTKHASIWELKEFPVRLICKVA
jgi:hypothetical protein